jgi:predicted nuclease of predicted toxin-antitoxin system
VSRKIKLPIDECLHTSLLQVSAECGYEAYHVVYRGLGGLKDHELMPKIREGEFTFVTNNACDFRRLFKRDGLNCGIIIILPNATPAVQRQLFRVALTFIGDRDLTNTAVEVHLSGSKAETREYAIP